MPCVPDPVTRRPSPFRALAAFLAATLVTLAAGPAAAAVADALADDARSYCERMGHTMPTEAPPAPSDPAACCVSAPEAPEGAVVPAPAPSVPEVVVATCVRPVERGLTVALYPPRDTGPPGGLRLHLSLSVFRV